MLLKAMMHITALTHHQLIMSLDVKIEDMRVKYIHSDAVLILQ